MLNCGEQCTELTGQINEGFSNLYAFSDSQSPLRIIIRGAHCLSLGVVCQKGLIQLVRFIS